MPEKTLKSKEEREKLLRNIGIDLKKDIVTSCQTGVLATLAYAGLKDIAKGRVRVFDGSLTEYNSR